MSSLWALRQFDFESFDPALLRAAMYLPPAYAVASEALGIEVKVKSAASPESMIEQFVMRESHEDADAAGLPAVGSDGGRWLVLKLDAAEAERLRRFRERLIAGRKTESRGRNTLELSATPHLCRVGAVSQGTAKVSGALRWSADIGYVTLLRDSDLDETMKSLQPGGRREPVPEC